MAGWSSRELQGTPAWKIFYSIKSWGRGLKLTLYQSTLPWRQTQTHEPGYSAQRCGLFAEHSIGPVSAPEPLTGASYHTVQQTLKSLQCHDLIGCLSRCSYCRLTCFYGETEKRVFLHYIFYHLIFFSLNFLHQIIALPHICLHLYLNKNVFLLMKKKK